MDNTLEIDVDKSSILKWLDEIGRDQSDSIPLLQKIQEEYGYLPREAMNIIAKNSKISARQLYGVATFYSQFRLNPIGRHLIKICHGTACHVRGADRINTSIRHALNMTDESSNTSKSGGYTLEDVACVGCCSLAPVMVIDQDIYGDLVGAQAKRSLKRHAKNVGEEI